MRTKWIVIAAVAVAWLAQPTRTSAGLIYSNSLQTGPGAEWQTSYGQWASSEAGLSNVTQGENRIFLNLANLPPEYEINFSANLKGGPGWGLYFGANLDSENRVSGFSFQYDPGFGAGAYLLRNWNNNAESVLLARDHLFDFNVWHDFSIAVTPTSLRVRQDNEPVLSYDGFLMPAGTLLGFRTWGQSEAVFQGFSANVTPEPLTLLLAIGPAFFFLRRNGLKS